jgi:SulP family sulfate permease
MTPDLATSALAVALLGLVQTAALAQSLAQQHKTDVNITREFLGQGASNAIGALFQGMPAGGSLSRTAVNISAGARTRLANVFAALFVALIILLFGGLIERIALAALAGHLVVAALSLIQRDQIMFVWRAGLPSRAVMLITLASTLALPLEYSIYVGVALTMLLYVGQSSHVSVSRLEPVGDTFREIGVPEHLPDAEPVILQVTGNLSFAAARDMQTKLPDPTGTTYPVVILRLRGDELLAGTGTALLTAYAERLHAREGLLLLCGVGEQVAATLKNTGAMQEIGSECVFPANDTLFTSMRSALAYAQQWLDDHQPDA